MPNRTKYLFDSDALISSARLYYAPSFCQAFWDWIATGHEAGIFYSIDKVKGELLEGENDPLADWAGSEELSNFFQPSMHTLAQWRKLSAFATDPARGFKESAKTKFLDVERADAWLIAYAAHHKNFVVVTNEVSAPFSKSEIKLPDAAAWLGVKTIKPYELLQSHAGHNFTFKLPSAAVAAAATIALEASAAAPTAP